jgi:hypothetical protein
MIPVVYVVNVVVTALEFMDVVTVLYVETSNARSLLRRGWLKNRCGYDVDV